MQINEYKCPNCGGAVKFDSSIQKMKCPYCDTEFETAVLEEYQKELAVPAKDDFGWNSREAGKPWESGDLGDLSTGACPSCGAELVGNKNTLAMVCPCCGNAQIVERRISGLLKPDYVIPFKLEKKAAVDALKEFYRGKRLLPDFFREENRVGGIQGIYLPFWLYDAKARAQIRYKATKTKVWSDSSYNYTKTDHYSLVRDGCLSFEKVPVDGSEKMDDSYMDAIEPFDYAQMTDFQSPYLAGYTAEKYDVDADKCRDRAGQRIKTTVEMEFAGSVVGYTSFYPESSTVAIESGKVSYSLFPAWILNTKYRKENYMFLMNGQSGRLVGRLPVDRGKFWKYLLLISGILGTVFTAAIQLSRIFL